MNRNRRTDRECLGIGKDFFLAITACPVLQKQDPRPQERGSYKNISLETILSSSMVVGIIFGVELVGSA